MHTLTVLTVALAAVLFIAYALFAERGGTSSLGERIRTLRSAAELGAVTLGDVNANLLPRVIAEPIFNRAVEQSAVMQLARRVPLAMTGQTAIPVAMDVPIADWVSEGQSKPVSSGSVGIKQMAGKKVATIVAVSDEVYRTNPAGLYQQLASDLPTALARAFDFAAIHGKRIVNGGAGPFAEHLASTTKEVALGTHNQAAGGLWADLVSGEADVVEDGWEFSGFAADPRLRPKLKMSVDNTGRPIFVSDLAGQGVAGGNSLAGYPVAFNRGVGGKLNRQSTTTDQGLRAIGGDWTQAAYGVGMEITFKESDQASWKDADGEWHSAFQDNMRLLLCEAYYGFVLGDAGAFVKYTDEVASV